MLLFCGIFLNVQRLLILALVLVACCSFTASASRQRPFNDRRDYSRIGAPSPHLPEDGRYLIDEVQCNLCLCNNSTSCSSICEAFNVGRGEPVQPFFQVLKAIGPTCKVKSKVQIPSILSRNDYCIAAGGGLIAKKPAISIIIEEMAYRQLWAHVYPGCGTREILEFEVGGGLLSPSSRNCLMPDKTLSMIDIIQGSSSEQFVQIPLGSSDPTIIPEPLDPRIRIRHSGLYKTKRKEPLDILKEALFTVSGPCLNNPSSIVFVHDVEGYFYGTDTLLVEQTNNQ